MSAGPVGSLVAAGLERLDAGGDPMAVAPRDPLLRFGWASALLEMRPALIERWATSEDRSVRRAVMRSPALDPASAEALVAARRSGMHTLGSNPAAPAALLTANPGAQQRRAAADAILPGGLDDARREPNRSDLVDLGSGTVDLVLARSPALDEATALLLAGRSFRPPDPWVAAVLIDRFGPPLAHRLGASTSKAHRRATRALLSPEAD